MSNKNKRFVIVGTGGRAGMFLRPLATTFKEGNEVVGLCDTNPARLEFQQKRLMDEWGYHKVPTYSADQFDQMIKETRPDTVLVCTVDAYHGQYIIRAMELGCDAITEKPMTIDDQKCRAILDTINKTGRKLRVTFNYRWGPGATTVKKLIQQGIIGDIIHVNMDYLLNTSHGADYFRRWHREKDKSGGLLVHKSTHHFDLINWFIDSVPDTVFAFGRLAFYGRENAASRGIEVKYDHYTGHDTTGDPFAFHLDRDKADKGTRQMYLEGIKYDGYRRDRNVFGENITIEDTMSVLVKYRTGIVLNYSLNAYLPREGFHIAFNGDKGRLEYSEAHASHILAGQNLVDPGHEVEYQSEIKVLPMFGQAYSVDIPKAEGGHGGADPLLQEQMFSSNPPPETLGRNAQHGQGAASILIGIAANHSMARGLPIKISDLCPQLGEAKRLSELP